MAPPAMINPIIEQPIIAVEPVLAPAIDAQPLTVEPALEPPTQPSSTFFQITPYTIHPIQPLPPTLPIAPPKINRYIYAKTLNKDGSQRVRAVCCKPQRQIIPNAVVPLVLPRGISEACRGIRSSFFLVSFHSTNIRYTYGTKDGYSRENAYCEAARCLRYLYLQQIALLDNTMDIDNDMYDVINQLLDDNEDTDQSVPLQRTLSLATTTTSASSCIIYDDIDDIDVDFGNFDDLPYQSHSITSSSMDIAPLIVNFDDDLVIDI